MNTSSIFSIILQSRRNRNKVKSTSKKLDPNPRLIKRPKISKELDPNPRLIKRPKISKELDLNQRLIKQKKMAMKKFETFPTIPIIILAIMFILFVLYDINKTKAVKNITSSYIYLVFSKACLSYCENNKSKPSDFTTSVYCLPKTFLKIKYSESCTDLVKCQCFNSKFYFECKMMSDIRKICINENEIILEETLKQ